MNKIKLLGFLGFLGLIGIPTKNYGFFGFFGFFSFFAAHKNSDERLSLNSYKAGFYAFIVALIGLSTLITAFSMNSGIALFSIILAVTFIAVILTFVISLGMLEKGVGK